MTTGFSSRMNSASCQFIQSRTTATPTSDSVATRKPEMEAPRKPSTAFRSVMKWDATRPDPSVSYSDRAIPERRSSMRIRMR